MATQRSANISITNDTSGNASIILFHRNCSNGTQRGEWQAAPGETVGPMKAFFETGFGSGGVLDYWCVLAHVRDGSDPGFYVSSGTDTDRYWKECQLQHADAGRSITLSVSNSTFSIALPSGGCKGLMTNLARSAPVTHVFVVMLENHSFDNIFAMSHIPGIMAATTADTNSYKGQTYQVQSSAPVSLRTDPGHEFLDVVEQLSGQHSSFPKGGPYPAINNSGFAANYATSTTEAPHKTPPPDDVIDIMACFDTREQLPIIYELATEFGICDHWHSSLPGPTWPNRFFLHGASSSGFDDSPTNAQMSGWEVPGNGFKYPNGSVFQRLATIGIPYRIYNDASPYPPHHSLYSDDPQNGTMLGAVPVVSALSDVSVVDIKSLRSFASDLQGPYPYLYTFIEPHYGNVEAGTYAGGSSQHPMDDVSGGENLLLAVYCAIRNSPYWNTSLLIIIYDEHGGFYDSVAPSRAPAPGDAPQHPYNTHGFDFTMYGVRVPAVVVSPLIPKGTVDHTLYDHSSVPRLLGQLWGFSPITKRDAHAHTPLHLLSLSEPRNTPIALTNARRPPSAAKPPPTAAERELIASRPVPQSGNIAGTLAILRKTECELSGGTPAEIAVIQAKYAAIRTIGDAQAYAWSVMDKVRIARVQRKLARTGKLQ